MQVELMSMDVYQEMYLLWKNTKGMGLHSIDDDYDGLEKFLKRNPTTCFIAREQNTVIGTMMAGHDGRRAHIYHACVDSQYRKQGVASILLEECKVALKEEGIHKISLVVFKDNVVGNIFWKQQGFTLREDLHYHDIEL